MMLSIFPEAGGRIAGPQLTAVKAAAPGDLAPGAPTTPAAATMARILLIDDDAAVRDIMRLMLAHLGHTIVEARDGKEGLDLFRPAAPDLVITDMVMPGMGGLEVVQRLREQRPDLKIIAMSGGNRSGPGACLQAARAAGAAAVLTKPFTFASLAGVIRGLLPAVPAGGSVVAG